MCTWRISTSSDVRNPYRLTLRSIVKLKRISTKGVLCKLSFEISAVLSLSLSRSSAQHLDRLRQIHPAKCMHDHANWCEEMRLQQNGEFCHASPTEDWNNMIHICLHHYSALLQEIPSAHHVPEASENGDQLRLWSRACIRVSWERNRYNAAAGSTLWHRHLSTYPGWIKLNQVEPSWLIDTFIDVNCNLLAYHDEAN